jgi:hypothetical protein
MTLCVTAWKLLLADGMSEVYANHLTWRFGMHVSGYARYSPGMSGRGMRLCLHTEIETRSRRLLRHLHIRPFIIFMGPPAFFSAHLHFQPNITQKKGGKHYRTILRRYPVGMKLNMRDGLRFGGLSMF